MNFQQEFKLAFGEKYSKLQLKSVVVKKSENTLIVTFFYPSVEKELETDEKQEIIDWFKDKLNLEQLNLKVKFMRVFVEKKLIMKSLLNFLDSKFKLAMTYLKEDNFKIDITPIDVIVEVELSTRLHNYFVENKIPVQLAKFLKENFLTEFVVKLRENAEIVDEVEIVDVPIKATYKVTKRYEVQIVKEVVGKDIPPKPEYLSNIKSQKSSVIVAGYIRNLERHEFVQKKGKNAGKSKTFYTFKIQDDSKCILDCIYFCSKANEKNMEALEDYMFLLINGDVIINKISGRLQLKVTKIALASQIEQEKQEKQIVNQGHVVNVEKVTAMEQDSLFEKKNKYSKKIMGRTIVVFDIETTGLDETSDEIIELGAVKIDNGNIIEKFSTFVKPTNKISYEITKLTGITDMMVENAPPIEPVIQDFYEFTRGCVLSGHNVINFDIKFIRREGARLGLVFDNELIDTINEARVARLKISHFNLANVLRVLGLKNEGAHRAWNDAFATAQALLKLNEV